MYLLLGKYVGTCRDHVAGAAGFDDRHLSVHGVAKDLGICGFEPHTSGRNWGRIAENSIEEVKGCEFRVILVAFPGPVGWRFILLLASYVTSFGVEAAELSQRAVVLDKIFKL